MRSKLFQIANFLEDLNLSHMPRLFLGQQSLYLEFQGVRVRGNTLEIF